MSFNDHTEFIREILIWKFASFPIALPSKPYIPDIIPEEDKRALEKYSGGGRVGFGKKPALLIIDMTNAFVQDQYPAGFAKTGLPCARAIRTLANDCREAQIPVIYTRSLPPNGNVKAQMGRWLDKSKGGLSSPEANEIFEELAPQQGDMIIEKAKGSAFFGTQLESILNCLEVDTLFVTGMITSGCVRATVFDAFAYNYRVVVPEECVADRSQISHKVNLFDMDSKYADVMKLTDVVGWIKSHLITVKT